MLEMQTICVHILNGMICTRFSILCTINSIPLITTLKWLTNHPHTYSACTCTFYISNMSRTWELQSHPWDMSCVSLGSTVSRVPHFSSLFEKSILSFIFCFCIRVRVEVISASFCWNLDSAGICLLPSASSDPSMSKRSFFSGLGGLPPSALLLSTLSLLHTIWFIFWNFSDVPNDSPIETKILDLGVILVGVGRPSEIL